MAMVLLYYDLEIERPIFIHTCATCSELPSSRSAMKLPETTALFMLNRTF